MYPNNAIMMNTRIAMINTFMPIFIIHFNSPNIIINSIAIIIISIIIFSPGYKKGYLRSDFVSFEPSNNSHNYGNDNTKN